MTEKLYDKDSYLTEFNCRIVSFGEDKNRIYIETDKTAFFLLGEVVEYDDTEKLFSMPRNKRTEDYITGRFG